MRLSIFWRLTIGFLAIIVLVSGVNLFALHQIRQITEFSNALVSTHYPAIDSAKWLTDSIYAQVRNEKKYLAVRDDVFLKHFDADAREFQHTLDTLLEQEGSSDGQQRLKEIETLHDDYRILFHTEARLEPVRTQKMSKEYESQRDAIVTAMTKHLESFVDLHEASIKIVKLIGIGDVAMEADAQELSEHINAIETAVEAIADRHVNEAVLARDRHGRLAAQHG